MVSIYVVCYDQLFKVCLIQCLFVFNYQCIDYCIFKGVGDISMCLVVGVVVMNGICCEGFQVGEAEIQFWMVGYWMWEDKVFGSILSCYF